MIYMRILQIYMVNILLYIHELDVKHFEVMTTFIRLYLYELEQHDMDDDMDKNYM